MTGSDRARIHRSAGVALLAAILVLPVLAPLRSLASEPIGPRILVRFVGGVAADAQTEILRAHGVVPVGAIPELDVVVAAVGDAAAADPSATVLSLFEEPSVASAELDRTRTATGTFGPQALDPDWVLRRVGASSIDPKGFSTLAILGTGVDVANPRITGRIMRGWSAFGGDGLDDANGQGTALAEIAVGASGPSIPGGVAPRGVLVLPIQVLDADGIGHDGDIARGIVEAVQRGADVILLSFGGAGYGSALQTAIEYAWDRGVVLVAPAGDGGSSTPSFPAASARVVGVGATTPIDTRWEGSNVGPAVFLAAPGLDVPVGRRTFTGTAAAAAIVAAGAGLLAALDPSAQNATLVARLARSGDAVLPRAEVGNGRLDLAAAVVDRSEVGFAPNGVVDGNGGPFVTTYLDTAPPLAGWALDHATFFRLGAVPFTRDGMPTPILTSGAGPTTVVPAPTLWYWSLATGGPTVGATLRDRSHVLGALIDAAVASDHGAYTYGSVSPPALAYGVLS